MSEDRLDRIERKLDTLVEVVAVRFNHFDGRLNQVDDRFNRIDDRFNRVDDQFAKVEAGILSLAQKTDRIERKVDSIEDTQRNINSDISEQLKRHERRLGALEARQP